MAAVQSGGSADGRSGSAAEAAGLRCSRPPELLIIPCTRLIADSGCRERRRGSRRGERTATRRTLRWLVVWLRWIAIGEFREHRRTAASPQPLHENYPMQRRFPGFAARSQAAEAVQLIGGAAAAHKPACRPRRLLAAVSRPPAAAQPRWRHPGRPRCVWLRSGPILPPPAKTNSAPRSLPAAAAWRHAG